MKRAMKAVVVWNGGSEEFYATTERGVLRRARQLAPDGIKGYRGKVLWYADGEDNQPLEYRI